MQLLCVFLSTALATTGMAPAADTSVPTPPTNPSEADQERGRVMFDNGYKLFQEGSYDEAIAAFRLAYGVSGDPTLLYNIALAAERAGQYDLALEYLQAYRVHAAPEEMEKLAEKAESFRKRKLNAALEAQNDGSGGTTEPATQPSRGNKTDAPEKPDKDTPRLFGPAAVVFTAIAGASFATALGLGLAARSRNADAEDVCDSGEAGELCSADADGDLQSSRKLALGADIMIGIGSASVLAVIVVLATNAGRRKRASKSVAVLPSPGGAGLGWRF